MSELIVSKTLFTTKQAQDDIAVLMQLGIDLSRAYGGSTFHVFYNSKQYVCPLQTKELSLFSKSV